MMAAAMLLACGASCLPSGLPGTELNPFTDLEAIPLDGKAHALPATIAPLGTLQVGDVLSVLLEGVGLDETLILIEDAGGQSGVLAGGGPANEPFLYRVQHAGKYYVLARLEPALEGRATVAELTVSLSQEDYHPPAGQVVRVIFEQSYLTAPGLVDPGSFTSDEIQLLDDLEPTVRAGVLEQLREIFAGTPVVIVDESQPEPEPPYSMLRFSPQRVETDDLRNFDSSVPAVHPESPCLEPVIFGEVLPRGTRADAGNRRLDDEAAVYVGSFQGRGLECRSAVISSLNTVVLALAHTGAHEIGHLVGLQHTATVDLMDRSPTTAFQRQLGFDRGQVLIEVPVTTADGTVRLEPRVQTTVYQEPLFYLDAIFE